MQWPGRHAADSHVLHQSSVSGFPLLCFPAGAFDHKQSSKRVSEWFKPAQQFSERGDRSHDERVIPMRGKQALGSLGMHRHPQASFLHDGFHGCSPLAYALGEFDGEVWAKDREQHARHATTGTNIEHTLSISEMISECHGISYVSSNKPFHVGVSREVEPFVPLPEARSVGRKLPLGGCVHLKLKLLTGVCDSVGEIG